MGLYMQNIEGSNSGIGTGRYHNAGFWRSDVTAPTTIRLDGGAIRFYAQSGVTADVDYVAIERMRITSAGNVGIGTMAPGDKLEVTGNIRTNVGNGLGFMLTDSSASGLVRNAGTGLALRTNSVDKLVIDSTGSVTFSAYTGTNEQGTPTYLLGTDASGNIVKTNTVPGSAAGPYLPLAGGTMTGPITMGNTSGSYSHELKFANNTYIAGIDFQNSGELRFIDRSGSRESITFNLLNGSIEARNTGNIVTNFISTSGNSYLNGGNVGIGTTSPNQKLHVNGATQLGDINATTNFNTVALKVVEGTISTGPTLGSGTVGAQAVLYSNGAFGMYTGVSGTGNTWMQSQRNDANTATYNILLNPLGGNVGIGVNNPSARLHVDGTVKFSSSGDRIFIADGGNGTFELGDIDGVSDEAKIVGDGSNIIISNTGTETLTCNSNNRVGIGTTNPSYKLDVSGDINGTNVYSNKLFTNIEESVANITSYSASSDTIFLPIDNVYPSDDYISVDDYSNYALPIFTVGDQVVIKNSNDSSEVIMQLVYDENFFSDPSALYSNATVVSGTLSGDYLYELGYISSATVINIDTDLTTILSAGNYIILGGIEYLISAITPNSITINASVENIQFINTVGLSTDFAMVSYKSTLSNGIAVQETPVLGFNIQKNKTFLKGSIDFFDSDTNQFIGKDSGASSVSEATFNTTSGYRTLYNNTTGSSNSAFGYEALNFNTTGGQNIALGYQALFANTTGSNNIALGNQSSWSNVTGYDNISIGASSMTQNNSGIRNLAIGTSSLYWNIYGNNNIGLGDESFASNRFGSDNVSIGYRAAFNSGTTVNNSVFVGSNTKPQGSNQSNQIVIGYDTTGNGSNTVTIGNSLITNNYFNGAINSNSFKVKALNVAPATSTSAGITGEIRYTSDYIYVCVATNTWKRTLLSTW
jgi:hypothetical protein